MRTRVLTLLVVSCAAACRARSPDAPARTGTAAAPTAACTTDQGVADRDDIYQLLAYAVVAARWQDGPSRQGHNIGAVLVSADGDPVYWETNANFAEASATEHAEARVIRNYLAHRRRQGRPAYRLTGDTIFTTLEPCAMCVGTMAMAGIARVVYGQTDPRYGKASERLQFDSRSRGSGFGPYPYVPESRASPLPIRGRIEAAYRASGVRAITGWLRPPDPRTLLSEAQHTFETMQPRCPGTDLALRKARGLYATARPGQSQ